MSLKFMYIYKYMFHYNENSCFRGCSQLAKRVANIGTKVNMCISKFLFMHCINEFMHAFVDGGHIQSAEVRAPACAATSLY